MRTRGLAVGIGLVLTFVAGRANAGQWVVMDETYVHAPELADSHYRVVPLAGTPEDWVSPIDWTQGSVWVHLEVLSKPTDQATKYQICFEAAPTYACTLQSPAYTEVGVYEWESTFAQLWSPPNQAVDWSLGVKKIAGILKDTMNGKPSADNVGPETAALYMPTELRVVVTLVEKGSVYEPPAPVGEETTGEATTDASTGEPDTTDAATSSTGEGTSSTGAPETTTGDASTTTGDAAPTTSSGGDAPTTGTGGENGTSTGTPTSASASDSDSGEAQGASEAGCGCRGTGEAPGGLALLLAGLAWRRRARAW